MVPLSHCALLTAILLWNMMNIRIAFLWCILFAVRSQKQIPGEAQAVAVVQDLKDGAQLLFQADPGPLGLGGDENGKSSGVCWEEIMWVFGQRPNGGMAEKWGNERRLVLRILFTRQHRFRAISAIIITK